jgi:hypothetical protein
MKDPFNSDFYVTVATIIPVLYLALTLQGSTLEQLLRHWKKVTRGAVLSKWNLRSELHMDLVALVAIYGCGIMFAGIVAEIIVLLALYHQSGGSESKYFVMVVMIGLLILVAAGPFLKFAQTFISTAGDLPEETETGP